jgi:hypothetical protein
MEDFMCLASILAFPGFGLRAPAKGLGIPAVRIGENIVECRMDSSRA